MDSVRDRVGEILKRAGLSHLPGSVLGVTLAVAGVAVVVAVWHWWPRSGPATIFPAGGPGATAGGVPASSLSSSGTGMPASIPDGGATSPTGVAESIVYVHVVGAVRRPGLYSLPCGARVADAIDRAGGLLGSAAERAVNLARQVVDGEQIVVPTLDEFSAGGGTPAGGSMSRSGGGGTAAGARVDINVADAALLDMLPGIGPSTAQRIVADREANGPFSSVDDLARVTGIGPKKLDALRDFVVVR